LLTDLAMLDDMTGRELGEAARRIRPNFRMRYAPSYTENWILRRAMLDPGVESQSRTLRRCHIAMKLREAPESVSPLMILGT